MPTATTEHGRSRSAAVTTELSLAEHVCLVLIAQGAAYGWALGTLLAPDGELGRIWSLTRPLTYRAIDGLVAKGIVARKGPVSGSGRERVPLTVTASGRRMASAWLDTPVTHLRDVRIELLLKLALRRRSGLDNTPLLVAQQQRFEEPIEALTAVQGDDDFVELWRRESARAVRRFLDQALRPLTTEPAGKPAMRLSARNQLRGTVTAVRHGDVMSTIHAVLGDGQPLTAAITKDAAQDLDLTSGDTVLVVIKSTEVMVAKAW
jgi:molybdopterin-binding protein